MLSESDTRAKLIDPAIHRRGWTEDLDPPRGNRWGHRNRRRPALAVALAAASTTSSASRSPSTASRSPSRSSRPSRRHLPPGHGLEQAKQYAAGCKRLNVPFVYSSNGHLYRRVRPVNRAAPGSPPPGRVPEPLRTPGPL
ncbi:MAG: hypothetical protein MZV65_42315 [Chromatiales bacterium]|nr:hypothetical protein [Chromatiales bacterium]